MLTLTVTDDGDGLPEGHIPGTGIRGMRERATLIGANLTIDRDPGRRTVAGSASRSRVRENER